jgi:hypothetical protein
VSARQQAGQLRSILARNFKKSRVREAAANILKQRGQVASGNLISQILKKKEEQMFSISFKIDSEFDVIYNVDITYDLGRIESDYYKQVDTVLGRSPSGMAPSYQKIYRWIGQKLRNGTWKGPASYTMTRTRKGGKKKTYTYPLSKLVYRKALAFVIARSIGERGSLKNRSPFITESKIRIDLAIAQSEQEFAERWPFDYLTNLEDKLTLLF